MHRFFRWRDKLQAAHSEGAVWRVLREYVESIPEDVRAALPADCVEALKDPDVQAAAVTLLHAELRARESEAQAALHEIAHTFAVAAVRLGRFSASETMPPRQ